MAFRTAVLGYFYDNIQLRCPSKKLGKFQEITGLGEATSGQYHSQSMQG